jgi:UDP-N-acetylmuramoyl-tripeptide--D-alanyl-D-alanine ligase
LFIAIRGSNFDGHEFALEAAAKGAAAVLVERGSPAPTEGCAVVTVENTRTALGRLASAYRQDLNLPVIGVAGSNGKTSTKDLLAAVLNQKLRTLASQCSFNNDIGVPLTLLNIDHGHQAAVVELGTNHPGELAPLVRIARPSLGVLTNIGREHLEFFGSVEGVAEEEGWIAELLPPGGTLFVDGDSPWTDGIVTRSRSQVVRVGLGDRNDWRVRGLRLDTSGVTFTIQAPAAAFSGEYQVSMLGKHQALNATFAIAAGFAFNLTPEQIRVGLLACESARMRLELWEVNGVRVLNDAYNANADSVRAALQTLQELPCKGRRLAVLGDMAELGRHAEAAHEEIGRCAAEIGVGQLFAVGKMAAVVARGARGAGLHRVIEFPDVDSAGQAVRSFVRRGDVLLLKASRAARLERVADFLRAAEAGIKN